MYVRYKQRVITRCIPLDSNSNNMHGSPLALPWRHFFRQAVMIIRLVSANRSPHATTTIPRQRQNHASISKGNGIILPHRFYSSSSFSHHTHKAQGTAYHNRTPACMSCTYLALLPAGDHPVSCMPLFVTRLTCTARPTLSLVSET